MAALAGPHLPFSLSGIPLQINVATPIISILFFLSIIIGIAGVYMYNLPVKTRTSRRVYDIFAAVATLALIRLFMNHVFVSDVITSLLASCLIVLPAFFVFWFDTSELRYPHIKHVVVILALGLYLLVYISRTTNIGVILYFSLLFGWVVVAFLFRPPVRHTRLKLTFAAMGSVFGGLILTTVIPHHLFNHEFVLFLSAEGGLSGGGIPDDHPAAYERVRAQMYAGLGIFGYPLEWFIPLHVFFETVPTELNHSIVSTGAPGAIAGILLVSLFERSWTPGGDSTATRSQPANSSAADATLSAGRSKTKTSGATDTPGSPAEDTTIEDFDSRIADIIDDVNTARRDTEFESAIKNIDRARSLTNDALDYARKTEQNRNKEYEKRLEEINTLRDEIQAERDTYQSVTEALESLSKQVDEVASQLDSDPKTTLVQLDEIEDDLRDVVEQMSGYEFSEATQTYERLRRRCEQLRKQVEDAHTGNPVPETIPSVPRQSLGYEDIERGDAIGSGGNADVYHATTTVNGKSVELALKEPRMSGTVHTETVERMMDEAETWQRLDDHDHIVSVVDYGAEPLPWIAMEYMDAGHLEECADEMSIDQKLWTAIVTTKAVRHAHRRGVAHLDLKPENILFCSVEDAWDVPKVADWGLSKHLLKHSKSVEGMSPHYAAPEQFDEEFGPVDDVTDVYQLGAVFYELFTGRPPFEGRPTKVMRAVMDNEPTPPSEIADVPPELDEILLTALAKEKDDRYETVIYLRDELQHLR